jgi:hypothetical protein
MQRAVHIVIDSGDDRHLKVVSGENLRRLVNIDVSFFPVVVDVVLDLVEIDTRRPAVDVNDGQEKVLSRDHHVFEFLL